jgi:Ala-tRNA(Pro) deacylase
MQSLLDERNIAMPVKKLKEFLDSERVKYLTVNHSPAYTAQEIAASAHVRGKEMAKTVIITIKGKMAMAVLPASRKIGFDMLREAAGAETVQLASEQAFRDMFPGCEVGAMPPFGNLYGMDVYVSKQLAEDEEIVFNAGSHTELIRMGYKDFERLVKPKVARIAYGE